MRESLASVFPIRAGISGELCSNRGTGTTVPRFMEKDRENSSFPVKEGSESLSIGKPWVFEGSYGTGITMRRFDERIVFVLKRVMLFWSEKILGDRLTVGQRPLKP